MRFLFLKTEKNSLAKQYLKKIGKINNYYLQLSALNVLLYHLCMVEITHWMAAVTSAN